MKNLEEKTTGLNLKNRLKKHPYILPLFLAANLAYFPVSIGWKVYLGKVIYEHMKKDSELITEKDCFCNGRWNSNVNRVDVAECDISYLRKL